MPSHANPVNWFEIPVAEMARAKKFYETVLAVEIQEGEMEGCPMGFFPMDQETQGATGALILGENYTPSHAGSLVYLHVDGIDPVLALIEKNGGKTLRPRTSIGVHGFIAHFEDTEGNRVALHESPAS